MPVPLPPKTPFSLSQHLPFTMPPSPLPAPPPPPPTQILDALKPIFLRPGPPTRPVTQDWGLYAYLMPTPTPPDVGAAQQGTAGQWWGVHWRHCQAPESCQYAREDHMSGYFWL